MAIEVMTGEKNKIALDFYISKKAKNKEFLTVRRFYKDRNGKWWPEKTNGMYLVVEEWNAIIPKLKEMIFYKTAPAGSPPFESDEEGKTFEDREEAPAGDDF